MKRRGEDGFLMTDALAAMFVVSTVSAGLMASFSLARHSSRIAEDKTLALFLAKDCLAETRPVARQIELAGTMFDVQAFESPLFVSEAVSSVTKRRCEIRWMQRGQLRQITLSDVEIAE